MERRPPWVTRFTKPSRIRVVKIKTILSLADSKGKAFEYEVHFVCKTEAEYDAELEKSKEEKNE